MTLLILDNVSRDTRLLLSCIMILLHSSILYIVVTDWLIYLIDEPCHEKNCIWVSDLISLKTVCTVIG